MAATDGQIILAASRFGDSSTSIYLRDFSKTELPCVAKIVKGQHQNLGVPTLSNPSLQSTALFLTAGKKYQILAQPIKIKEGRKPTNVGPKVLIPETYAGYFELLSEDGRSTRCIDTVLELSRKSNLRVLVRETFRCNHLTKTIHAGEILTTMYDNGKYLKCKNQNDETIHLPLEAKAKFSPIAREDSISGVHTVKNLLKKRMPVVVRLVHGIAPKGLKQPFVPELRLLGCVEVDRIFALPLQKDMDLVAVPLNAKLKMQRAKNMDQLEDLIEYTRLMEKAQRLLADARDRLQVVDLKLSEKEKKDSKLANKRIPIISGLENGYILRRSASCDSNSKMTIQTDPLPGEYDEIDQIYDYVRGFAPLPKSITRFDLDQTPTPVSHKTSEYSRSQLDSGNYSIIKNNNVHNMNLLNNSINNNNNSVESINCNGGHYHVPHNYNIPTNHHHHHHHHTPVKLQPQQQQQHDDDKPIPPPIETIPGKKIPEKRQRPTLPKLYVKNNSSSTGHHQKQPITTTNGNTVALIINNKDNLEPQSPLFHIRYKSLSSLQLTPDSNPTTPISTTTKNPDKIHHLTKSASTHCAKEGTLDSSRSGGRTSGDSKLPEKKTRRLSRPRSLSNLVWELRPQKDKTKKKFYVHHFDQRQQATLYL